jgi:hypothetical protein
MAVYQRDFNLPQRYCRRDLVIESTRRWHWCFLGPCQKKAQISRTNAFSSATMQQNARDFGGVRLFGGGCTCMFCMCLNTSVLTKKKVLRALVCVIVISIVWRLCRLYHVSALNEACLLCNREYYRITTCCYLTVTQKRLNSEWFWASGGYWKVLYADSFVCVEKISVKTVLTFEHTLHRICIFELLWRNLLEIYWQFRCISVSLLEY